MSAESESAAELQPGQMFEGKYKILRELGRGGFGMVYLAFQEGMDRHVALKVLKSSVTAQAPSAKERFLREVKIISKLKHPNTVTIHDFGETYDGGLYMVLEFVEGETLKQVVKREGAQDALRAADLARQIARSLSEAHRHGVVHRDLKPANIMITSIEADKDFVKVLDFGVARLLDPKTNDLTSVGLPEGERELIGTPRYMSPEQVRGESLTGASDIYGLGLMLYEMLCGEPAVQGDTTMGLITQQISPEPLKLPHLHHFHPTLQDVIRISTSKRLQDRFQTAEQMADALENSVFQVRRERNLTGPQSGDVPMQSYQSQLTNAQSGWVQQNSGWHSNTPSGSWMAQSGSHQPLPHDPRNPYGSQQMSGFNPGPASPVPHPSHHPGHPSHGSGMNPYHSGLQAYPQQPQQQQQPPHQPQYPSPFGSGLNLELPDDDDDFKPTVERSALDPSQIVSRPQSLFDRNQHPSAELPKAELPPVPVDHRPFEVRKAEVENRPTGPLPASPPVRADAPASASASASSVRPRPAGPPEESMTEFAVSVSKICVLATVGGVATFVTFLVLGAWYASFADGSVRLIAAALTALAIPGVISIAESSRRERFRVVEPTTQRIAGIFLRTILFCFAMCFILSAAFAGTIVGGLQSEPNWYLDDQEGQRGFPALNKRISYGLADVIAESMGVVGLYKKKGPPVVAAPSEPVPGRTKALPPSTRKGNQQIRSTDPDAPKSEIPEDGQKGQYVDW